MMRMLSARRVLLPLLQSRVLSSIKPGSCACQAPRRFVWTDQDANLQLTPLPPPGLPYRRLPEHRPHV